MSILDGRPPDVLTGALGSLALLLARVYRIQVVEVLLIERRQGRVDGGSGGEQSITTTIRSSDQSEDGGTRRLDLERHVRVVQLDRGERRPVRKRSLVSVDDVNVFETSSAGNTGGRVDMKRAPMLPKIGLGFDCHVVLLPEDCGLGQTETNASVSSMRHNSSDARITTTNRLRHARRAARPGRPEHHHSAWSS